MKIQHYRPFFTGLLSLTLAVACAVLAAVYGFTRWEAWMTVGVTLCGVLVVMFVVLLGVNCYYEKKY